MKVVWLIAVFIGGIVIGHLLTTFGYWHEVSASDGAAAAHASGVWSAVWGDLIGSAGGGTQGPRGIAVGMSSYLGVVGILLTAVTVILTAVAIGIGIVAAITFSGIRVEAKKTADKKAKEVARATAAKTAATTASETAKGVAQEALSEVKVRALVYELVGNAIGKHEVQEELAEDFDASDSGER